MAAQITLISVCAELSPVPGAHRGDELLNLRMRGAVARHYPYGIPNPP